LYHRSSSGTAGGAARRRRGASREGASPGPPSGAPPLPNLFAAPGVDQGYFAFIPPPSARSVTFSTCDAGTLFDTVLTLFTSLQGLSGGGPLPLGASPQQVATNDDAGASCALRGGPVDGSRMSTLTLALPQAGVPLFLVKLK
jgi:hypothetical protein